MNCNTYFKWYREKITNNFTKVELQLKDGDKIIGHYEDTENRMDFLTPYSNSQMVFGTLSRDIKDKVCLGRCI